MSWKFEPIDFQKAAIHCCGACASDVVEAANDKLAEWLSQAKVVYSDKSNCRWSTSPADHADGAYNFTTHKALLISIEPIEQCKHEASRVQLMADKDNYTRVAFYCECGSVVKPITFEVVK